MSQVVKTKKHDIFFDRAGWGNYPRYTCLVCNATLLKKPYQTRDEFNALVEKFKKDHPEEEVSDETTETE